MYDTQIDITTMFWAAAGAVYGAFAPPNSGPLTDASDDAPARGRAPARRHRQAHAI